MVGIIVEPLAWSIAGLCQYVYLTVLCSSPITMVTLIFSNHSNHSIIAYKSMLELHSLYKIITQKTHSTSSYGAGITCNSKSWHSFKMPRDISCDWLKYHVICHVDSHDNALSRDHYLVVRRKGFQVNSRNEPYPAIVVHFPPVLILWLQ